MTLDLYVTRVILQTLALNPKIRDSCLAFLAVVDNWGARSDTASDVYSNSNATDNDNSNIVAIMI